MGENSRKSSTSGAAAKNNVFKFNTNVGQHILKNPGIADAIVDKANLKPTDTVLEIGPGTGNISVRILEKAKRLVAVELDPRMASEITKRVMGTPSQKKLEVLLGDAIKLDFPPHDVCISNTPYQISSPLVFKLLSMPNPPRCCVLMFQREFALRLTARPGDPLYNRLSVNAQFFSKITHIMKVGRQNFRPPPQVESSVVRIEPKLGKDRPAVSWAEFDGLLRIVFSRKNKTVRASFGTKEVLALVERNYRTWCALNNVPVDETIVEDGGGDVVDEDASMDVDGHDGDGEWGGIMDVDGAAEDQELEDEEDNDDDDDDLPAFFKEQTATHTAKTPSRRKKTKVAELVRSKVTRVLQGTDMADQRAGKLDENAFLKLLYAFNKENIHFA
ncbi:rRNA adenine dimethylase [Cryphonectria parasitica EP155]|uniref:rRNA adenine N(6)-methyltransferase n=1 Tax=Cryphonectria parasitica (strain ATCC 38755 / EP155) TaxID=660469 RepID=A0A9P4XTR8_CRYP1|nr:rRNA adenine dimethylase [Cryphonectria parasitica EP155]KAF3760630.1 rRNA adenine dimethylase [Cryphonectria parasitica EP155]